MLLQLVYMTCCCRILCRGMHQRSVVRAAGRGEYRRRRVGDSKQDEWWGNMGGMRSGGTKRMSGGV